MHGLVGCDIYKMLMKLRITFEIDKSPMKDSKKEVLMSNAMRVGK